jgi:hypothetical protein
MKKIEIEITAQEVADASNELILALQDAHNKWVDRRDLSWDARTARATTLARIVAFQRLLTQASSLLDFPEGVKWALEVARLCTPVEAGTTVPKVTA